MGDLAVARSLGDTKCHPYITTEPNVHEAQLEPDDEFLILACDGLWDVVSDEAAVRLVRNRTPEVR